MKGRAALTLLFALALLGACGRPVHRGTGRADAHPASRIPHPGVPDTPPALGPPPPLTLPPVATRRLPNGLELLVVEHHELPLADVVLLVHAGGEADPPDRAGVAAITADMLDEGTVTRSSLAIADQEAYLGVALGTESGWDASRVTLHAPTAQLDSALALFADVALHPAFPAADFERLRAERLTQLVQLRDRAPAIADRAFAAIVYGRRHPYGRPLSGTEASVAAITRADLRRFYERYFRPNNATLIVVGDVTPDDVERRARRLFAEWERREVPAVSFGETPPARPTTVYLIDKPGAEQASVRVGGVGAPRSTADYFALQVMNTILGGSFTSRLNRNLREAHGYTYGASSGFAMRRAAGPFVARAEVVAEKTDSALVELLAELRSIRRDTVSTSELTRAERYLALQLPAEFESTGDIAAQLVPLVLYGLPSDYYSTYVQRIERVSQADVRRAAERYIAPDSLAVVIVGDRASIEARLRALRVGDVVTRDIEGNPAQP